MAEAKLSAGFAPGACILMVAIKVNTGGNQTEYSPAEQTDSIEEAKAPELNRESAQRENRQSDGPDMFATDLEPRHDPVQEHGVQVEYRETKKATVKITTPDGYQIEMTDTQVQSLRINADRLDQIDFNKVKHLYTALKSGELSPEEICEAACAIQDAGIQLPAPVAEVAQKAQKIIADPKVPSSVKAEMAEKLRQALAETVEGVLIAAAVKKQDTTLLLPDRTETTTDYSPDSHDRTVATKDNNSTNELSEFLENLFAGHWKKKIDDSFFAAIEQVLLSSREMESLAKNEEDSRDFLSLDKT